MCPHVIPYSPYIDKLLFYIPQYSIPFMVQDLELGIEVGLRFKDVSGLAC